MFLPLIAALILLSIFLTFFLKNHYKDRYIIEKAKIDIVAYKKNLTELMSYLDSITSIDFPNAYIECKPGTPNQILITLHPEDNTQKDKNSTTIKPFFIKNFLLYGNNLDIHYYKDSLIKIDYPYSNYRLKNTVLIYCYNQSEYIKDCQEKGIPVYQREADKNSLNKDYVIILDSQWCIKFYRTK